MAENEIANNLLAQVDQDGQRFVLFNNMIDHRTDRTEIKEEGELIHMANVNKHRRETTK